MVLNLLAIAQTHN